MNHQEDIFILGEGKLVNQSGKRRPKIHILEKMNSIWGVCPPGHMAYIPRIRSRPRKLCGAVGWFRREMPPSREAGLPEQPQRGLRKRLAWHSLVHLRRLKRIKATANPFFFCRACTSKEGHGSIYCNYHLHDNFSQKFHSCIIAAAFSRFGL